MPTTALILAAGRGSRLRPLTDTVPKVLLTVRGSSIVEIIVDELLAEGIQSIVFITGYLGEQVKAHFQNHPDAMKFAFIEQVVLDGTGGAVRLAKDRLQGDFLVVFGDSLYAPGSLGRLTKSGHENGLCVVAVEDPQRYGIVAVDEAGTILDVEEKPLDPKTNLAIAGAYKFSHRSLAYFENLQLSKRGEYEIPDAIRAMISDGVPVHAVPIDGMVDVGTLDQLEAVNRSSFSFTK